MLECQVCRRITSDDEGCCPDDGGALVPLLPGPPVLDGKYLMVRSIDRGASGLVAVAEHLGLHQLVAVKMLDPLLIHSSQAQVRFRAEAEALGRLQHPGIIRVNDFGIDQRGGGTPYIVLELAEGESLRDRLTSYQRLDLSEALAIFEQIAAALDHAHEQGICHRDLKPENVLLTPGPKGDTIKIIDFGLACETGPAADSASGLSPSGVAVAGTPEYMAPEVLAAAPAGPAADIYAMGVLVYEMLTGRCPFEADPSELPVHHLCSLPTPPSQVCAELPAEIDSAILGALAKEPSLRPARAGELHRSLIAAAATAEQRAWLTEERPRRLLLATLIVAAALLATWLLSIIGLIETGDRQLVRAGFSLSQPRAPDPRLLIVSIDEATARDDSTLIAERAGEVGRLLAGVIEAGAVAVGIDLLLPEQWSRSESFSNLVIQHDDSVTLALAIAPDGSFIGDACVHGPATVVLGPARSASLFGIVNIDVEADGSIYLMRSSYSGEDGSALPSFANRIVAIAEERAATQGPGAMIWIDYSVPQTSIPRLSWSDLDTVLQQTPDRLAGRVVLVGQELTGAGDIYHDLPHPAGGKGQTTGLELQALMVNTLLKDRPIQETGPGTDALIVGVAAALLAAVLLLVRRPSQVLRVTGLLMLLYAIAAVGYFIWKGWIITFSALLVSQMIVAATALLIRGRLRPRPQLSGMAG